MLDVKKEAKKLVFGVLFITGLYFLFYYFDFSLLQIYLTMLVVSTGLLWYKQQLTIKNWGTNAVYLGGFLVVIGFLRGLGTIGYVLTIIIICGAILWRKRKDYVQIKHHIETMIWGKTLKEFIELGEKPPKVKINKIKA